MFRVNGKIERLFLFDPLDAKWQWIALSLLPSRSFHEWDRDGFVRPGGTTLVGEHINARTVHNPSLSSTRPQCGSVTTPPNCGNELSNLLAPFQKICTPMHTSRNAVSFKMTLVPVAPTLLASRSA